MNAEADDIIASLVFDMSKNPLPKNILIISSDKDFFQLSTGKERSQAQAVEGFGTGRNLVKLAHKYISLQMDALICFL